MDSSNLIFNMPFDEQSGALIAYDYTGNRADGQLLDGAEIVKGNNGNAVKFGNGAHCDVDKCPFEFGNEDFTLSFLAKCSNSDVGVIEGKPTMYILLLNFGGVDEYEEVFINSGQEVWKSLALVRKGGLYAVYVDDKKVKEIEHDGNLSGISVNQDFYGTDTGMAIIDSVKVYNEALTYNDIINITNDNVCQSYTIDSVDIKSLGVFVSSSKGILDKPKLKEQKQTSWDNYHGVSVDLDHKYFEPRTITLECFIKADDRMEFISRLNKFYELFEKNGTQRLMISIHPIKALVYEVYLDSTIELDKIWHNGQNVGTFTLTLVEPSPVKRVLKHICADNDTNTCTMSMHTEKMINIHWGDGTVEYDLDGDIEISHTYSSIGNYYPIISGCINEITEFTTNAIILWNKL